MKRISQYDRIFSRVKNDPQYNFRTKQEFVQWLIKMGIHFLGFMDLMHTIETNAVILNMLLSLSSLDIKQARINKPSIVIKRIYNWTCSPFLDKY